MWVEVDIFVKYYSNIPSNCCWVSFDTGKLNRKHRELFGPLSFVPDKVELFFIWVLRWKFQSYRTPLGTKRHIQQQDVPGKRASFTTRCIPNRLPRSTVRAALYNHAGVSCTSCIAAVTRVLHAVMLLSYKASLKTSTAVSESPSTGLPAGSMQICTDPPTPFDVYLKRYVLVPITNTTENSHENINTCQRCKRLAAVRRKNAIKNALLIE